MRPRVVYIVVVVLGLSPAALAQSQAAGSPSTQAKPAAPPAGASQGPDALLGLRPTAAPKAFRFDDAMRLAAEGNWDLRVIKEHIDQQEAQLKSAWSALLPQVSLGANYTYSFPEQKLSLGSQDQSDQQALLFQSLGGLVAQSARANPDPAQRAAGLNQAAQLFGAASDIQNAQIKPIVITPAHVVNGQLTVTIPLFNGRAIPAIQNAYQAIDLARATVDQSRAQVVLGIARSYYGAWTAHRFVDISMEQLTSSKAHRDLTKTQTDAGLLTPLALQRAELDVVRAEQAVRSAKQSEALAIAGLGQLLGVNEVFTIEEPPAVPGLDTQMTVDKLIERARDGRPDLAVQRMSVDIAGRGITDAWMQWLPQLSVQGQARYTTNTTGLTTAPVTGAVVVQATVPLYDGGARNGAMDQAESRVREEQNKLHELEDKIESQVRGNVDDIHMRIEALDSAKRAVDLARATQDNAKRLYDLGTATNLDVVDANVSLYSAELDLARAELDVAQGRLGLAYILGDLQPQAAPRAAGP